MKAKKTDLTLYELLAIFKFGTYIKKNFRTLYEIKHTIIDSFFQTIGLTKEDVEIENYTWHNIWAILPHKRHICIEISNNFIINVDHVELLKEQGLEHIYFDEGIVFMFKVEGVIEV